MSRPVRFATGFVVFSLLSSLAAAQLDSSLDPMFGDARRAAFAIVSRDPPETPGALN